MLGEKLYDIDIVNKIESYHQKIINEVKQREIPMDFKSTVLYSVKDVMNALDSPNNQSDSLTALEAITKEWIKCREDNKGNHILDMDDKELLAYEKWKSSKGL